MTAVPADREGETTVRLRLLLEAHQPERVPLNHQDLLRGVVYRLLGESDADYARFLHDDGYVATGAPEAANRRYKLFTFSTLQVPRGRRRIDAGRGDLCIAPGPLTWWIGSPVEAFLRNEVTGLLTAAGEIRVGRATFAIAGIEAVPAPRFADNDPAEFTCLTPIVAAVPDPARPTPRYLRPSEGPAFSEAVRQNLIRKYRALHGAPPADDRLELRFDPAYLARDSHGGTKKITIRETDVIGAFAPFTLAGSAELMTAAWECGLGEKNSTGFGMIDIDPRDRSVAGRGETVN